MGFKRMICAALTIAMLTAMAATVSAGTFPDVLDKHSWAQEYIEDMVKRGLIKGYTDGTFKPDNPISKLEAVILSARILGVTYEENKDYVDIAAKAYEAELKDYNIQYKTEAAYLLYLGVLTPKELPLYIGDSVKNTAMKRYEVAVLLTKVLGGERIALENAIVVLDYSDDSSVPADAKPYVQFVSESGIMKGMEDNKFNPMFEVTRAMIATMMYRCEQAMDLETVEMSVVSVNKDANSLTAKSDGAESQIVLDRDTFVKVDGLDAELSDLKAGYDIRVHYQGEKVRYVEASAAKYSEEKTGVIKALSDSSGVKKVTVTPTGGANEATVVYTLDSNCVILVDNLETTFSALKNDYFIRITVKNGKTVKIVAETKEQKITGTTITKIDTSGETPVIHIAKGSTSSKYELSADSVVLRNSVETDFRSLSVGDTAELTVQAGRIKRITATSVNKTVEGTIEQIVISAAPAITIKVGDKSVTYLVSADTVFYVENEQVTIYDMRLGATATVTLKSESIDTIKMTQQTVPSQLIGTVSYVNPVYGVLGLIVTDPATGKTTTHTLVVKSSVKIIDNTSTRVTALKGITAGRAIIALGELDNYGTYAVTTIIITQ